jgi:SMC interacting uncharacterized protein involved in chromosome segregation
MTRLKHNLLFGSCCVVIALGVLLGGCIDMRMPSWLQKEQDLEKEIGVAEEQLEQLKVKKAKADAAAQKDPTPINLEDLAKADAAAADAELELVEKRIELEQLKKKNADAKAVADQTADGAVSLAQQYGGPFIGGIALSLIPYLRLLGKHRGIVKERDARDATMANILAAVQPLIDDQSDATKREIKERQTKAANDLVTELQDKAKL